MTPSAGPIVMGKIGKDDCEKWATRDVQIVFADWKDATSKCAPGVREGILEKLDGQKASIKDGAVAACTKHLGEEYSSLDSGCYMGASTVKALANCHFVPMTIPEDADLPGQLDRLRASCAPPAPRPSP